MTRPELEKEVEGRLTELLTFFKENVPGSGFVHLTIDVKTGYLNAFAFELKDDGNPNYDKHILDTAKWLDKSGNLLDYCPEEGAEPNADSENGGNG